MFRLFNQAWSGCTRITDNCDVLYNSAINKTVDWDLKLVTIGDHVLSQKHDDKMFIEIWWLVVVAAHRLVKWV
jgi:hypothetical protein